MTTRYSFGWKKIRQIKSKTNGTCAYCGNQLPEDTFHPNDGYSAQYHERNWQVDHVIPVSRGGGNNIENLVPACVKCNANKSNMSKTEFMELLKGKSS